MPKEAKCIECGDLIKIPTDRGKRGYVCAHCLSPITPSVGNSYSSGHYEDDMSGASSSWDSAVKLNEEKEAGII